VKIVLNGESFEVLGSITVTHLLTQLNIDPRRVAVEHNLVVVKKAAYSLTVINEDDVIEVVNFVGGG
jgi:thiazole synthase